MNAELLLLAESLLRARGCTSADEVAETFGVTRRAALRALRALVERNRAVRLAFKAVPTAVVCSPPSLHRAGWVPVRPGGAARVPVGPLLEQMCCTARSARGGLVSIRPAALCSKLIGNDGVAYRLCVEVAWALVALLLAETAERRVGMGGRQVAVAPRELAVSALCTASGR